MTRIVNGGHLLLGDCTACLHTGSHIASRDGDVWCFRPGCRCNGDFADGSTQDDLLGLLDEGAAS